MPLFSLTGISFDYGRVPILKDVDLSLEPEERASIVGRNGVGKSTLFALISGELRPDDGRLERSRRLRVAYLRQDHALAEGKTLFQSVRDECRELVEIEARLGVLLAEMEALPHDSPKHERSAHEHGELQHRFEALGGYDLDQRVAATLSGLGFAAGDFERPVAQLSGGEQRVAALAGVLLQKADLLLLDEPTNHLDLPAIEWLEEHLLQQKAALLMVSHDRAFLNKVSRLTFHLRDAVLTRYSGNYSFYEKERQERERLGHLAYERQQEEIARMEEYIRRNIVGQKTKQAQSRRKRLEKMERLTRPSEERTLRVRLSPARRGGNTVLAADKLAKAFGEKRLFAGVDLHVARGEKIGLVGPNGAGKTTLVRILMGQLPPDAGSVRLGKDIDLGFFDQHLDLVSDGHTVEEEFRTVDPFMSEGECRGQLARFGFFADDLDKRVGQLSGGERNRLSLLKLVYQRHNFLVLDEPTNHLDIAATESLEEALEAYEGTLLVISHDRSFLGRLAQRVLSVEGGKLTDYPGSWSEFTVRASAGPGGPAPRKGSAAGNGTNAAARSDNGLAARKGAGEEKAAGAKDGSGGVPQARRWSKNKFAQKQRSLAELEARIAEAVAEREEMEAKLSASHELDRQRLLDLTCRHAEILETIARREERWARLALEIEEQESPGDS